MTCPIGLPALARCALDGTLRTSTSNRCSLSCSSRCFQRCPACSCSWNTATTRSGRWWRLHFLHSTWLSGRPACPRRPHCPRCPTQYTHTQSHNRRHGSRLGAGRRGWDAAEQRSRGRLAAASEARLAGSGFDRVLAGPTDLAAAGSRTGRASARVVQTARGPLRGASSLSPAGRTERWWVAAAATRDKLIGEPL